LAIEQLDNLAIANASLVFQSVNHQLANYLAGELNMATATKDSTVKDAQNGSVRVEIFDQAYNLRGSDPEYISKLAEYVDAKMRAVAEATNTIDTVRLAVLAALNIADEYHLLKRTKDTGATDYQKRAHLLADALDQVLRENDSRKAG
jgi:cell division protein ZapA